MPLGDMERGKSLIVRLLELGEAGRKVLRGDRLVSIEAMKMETAVSAERDGTIGEVIAKVGMRIGAKDLLIVFDD